MLTFRKKYLKEIHANIYNFYMHILKFFIIFSIFFISKNGFAELSDTEKDDLFSSIEQDTKKLKHFLDHEGDPNLTLNTQTLLHKAVMQRNLEATQLLLDAKANLELTNEKGNTPLLELTDRPDPDSAQEQEKEINILKALLDAGANPNQQNFSGYTPLSNIASNQRLTALAALLLQSKADPFFDFDNPSNFIKLAIRSQNTDIVSIICHNPFFVDNLSFEQKKELLLIAIQNGYSYSTPILITSIGKIPLHIIKRALEREFLPSAFDTWIKIISGEIETRAEYSFDFLRSMMTFISLLIWYRYETHQLQKFNVNFKQHIPKRIKKLLQDVEELLQDVNPLNNRTFENSENQKLIAAGKNIINWIVNYHFAQTRPEDFFNTIGKYLALPSQSRYEKWILYEATCYLILKGYFLNPTILDKEAFFKLKEPLDLKDDFLPQQSEELKTNLRLMYAKELKNRFLFFTAELNLLKNSYLDELNGLNVQLLFSYFRLLKQKENAMQSYCKMTSSPVVHFILENIRTLENQAVAQWIQDISHDQQTGIQFLTKSIIVQYNQNASQKLHAFFEHLELIIQTNGQNIYSKTLFCGKDILNFKTTK